MPAAPPPRPVTTSCAYSRWWPTTGAILGARSGLAGHRQGRSRRTEAGAHRAGDQQGRPGHPFRRRRGFAGQLPERCPFPPRWRDGLHHRFRRTRRHRRRRSAVGQRARPPRRPSQHAARKGRRGRRQGREDQAAGRPPVPGGGRRHCAVDGRPHALLAGAHRSHALPYRYGRADLGQSGRRRAQDREGRRHPCRRRPADESRRPPLSHRARRQRGAGVDRRAVGDRDRRRPAELARQPGGRAGRIDLCHCLSLA